MRLCDLIEEEQLFVLLRLGESQSEDFRADLAELGAAVLPLGARAQEWAIHSLIQTMAKGHAVLSDNLAH
jgi:hypothetical protein